MSDLKGLLSRRDLVAGGVSACLLSAVGCSDEKKSREVIPHEVTVGPLSALRQGLTVFPILQIGLVRRDNEIFALRMVCTHQRCALSVPDDDSSVITCPCHGSQFSIDGEVLKGPANLNLPRYPTRVNDQGIVVVQKS